MSMRLYLCGLITCVAGALQAQQPDSLQFASARLTERYVMGVEKKADKVSAQLDKQTALYLRKLEKQEQKLRKRLAKLDSAAANRIFATGKEKYAMLQNALTEKSAVVKAKAGQYLPWLDSASTSLRFLQNNQLLSDVKRGAVKLKSSVAKINQLKEKLNQAGNVQDFIAERKEYLKTQLQQYHLGSELKKYNQTAYYYSQQVQEYRLALSEPDKAERKLLEALNQLPAFKAFMQRNSMLASLFSASGEEVASAITPNLQGLQTAAAVQGLLQNQITSGGPAAQEQFQQGMTQAQNMLGSLKSKLNNISHSDGQNLDAPDFKPNTQRTKSFLKRIEYSANVQSVRGSFYYPTNSDLAVMAGYRLNDKSTIGFGISYKWGWGKDIKHIAFSSEGVGFRSFIDIKMKGNFYASGGWEYNYQQPFKSLQTLQSVDAWQKSGLIGLGTIISVRAKYFKKTKVQFLWDFLSYQQRPVATPLKFRVGYGL